MTAAPYHVMYSSLILGAIRNQKKTEMGWKLGKDLSGILLAAY